MADYNPIVRTNTENKREIFDPVRKRYVALTEEESVRQFIIFLLNSKLNVSYALMGVEKQIKVCSMIKRPDIIVFDNKGNVKIIVECKAPNIEINQETLDQIIRYNMTLKAKYLILTNGKNIYCVECNNNEAKQVAFQDIVLNN
ncbi:type I restriction enzyme HsdR N-terminal domain-containing protein [Bacteroidales bacterium OttesenSCG-928-K03]|nr:type I restriction enzyme HsdR N-terminal domain-containing protein [Odoribacter sp. OttesenSCG-928-L07]MDL2239516.1 type I restriction enzyme HsdR N-terminal domain-containing protein [Bacteroidales bacterium OttesenSCG-928-L14]MDL2243042.1 type I restriction enzyme HsdR N-terminal domain-containing protein [Bacteroidales bacterium OttesenSCG-928-K03]